MSGQCVLASLMIYNGLMTSEKQLSSTVNTRGSASTLLQCRRPDSLQMTASGNKTTQSFGRERNQMNQDCMVWALQWETLYCLLLKPPYGGTTQIIFLCLLTSSGPANFLSIYASTLCSPAENKNEFYEELESSIWEIPLTEHLYLLGDFNAWVGANHSS